MREISGGGVIIMSLTLASGNREGVAKRCYLDSSCAMKEELYKGRTMRFITHRREVQNFGGIQHLDQGK